MSVIKSLLITDANFPEQLRAIAGPPKRLYFIGPFSELVKLPCLSVVGSRRVSPYGSAVTSSLVTEVASCGVVIISGLALGVDALAHHAALEGRGKTIAVLASGLDSVSPRSNVQLARRILQEGGAIVSEYPIGTPPLRQNFVARNRIVSGLSRGVLVTEAAAKSGTLHTANFALEQGRTVMAVPGNITSKLSEGTNNLIKAGATPVTSAEDILEALGLEQTQTAATSIRADNAEEAMVITLLRQGITDSSELLAKSRLEAAVFNQTLTMLEISGSIRPLGAGHWCLK